MNSLYNFKKTNSDITDNKKFLKSEYNSFLIDDKYKNIILEGKFKTELCETFKNTGKCRYKKVCTYAHGIDDLRENNNITKYYKTRECKNFKEKKYCTYGKRCNFIHNIKLNDRVYDYWQLKFQGLFFLTDKGADQFLERSIENPRESLLTKLKL